MSTETPTNHPGGPGKPPVFANKMIKFLLGTPLHGAFSKVLMLITFKGRKSGKHFTTPVGYQRNGDLVLFFTDHPWWKNLMVHPEVTLRIQGKTLHGLAEVVHDDYEVIANELDQYIRNAPMAARPFKVELDENKQPRRASIEGAARVFTLIRVRLNR